ncbi:hypothetical protein SGL43_03171 [Streptomyces globisporus]|uniref:Uncharacterized protein n=1 Tax=Streptomyces globisporus TaxID=1908 RepID=A0ABN8V5F5_STRGL|nr:hypothetical protein SGL43_03171 [Streptomyces globisporus]
MLGGAEDFTFASASVRGRSGWTPSGIGAVESALGAIAARRRGRDR